MQRERVNQLAVHLGRRIAHNFLGESWRHSPAEAAFPRSRCLAFAGASHFHPSGLVKTDSNAVQASNLRREGTTVDSTLHELVNPVRLASTIPCADARASSSCGPPETSLRDWLSSSSAHLRTTSARGAGAAHPIRSNPLAASSPPILSLSARCSVPSRATTDATNIMHALLQSVRHCWTSSCNSKTLPWFPPPVAGSAASSLGPDWSGLTSSRPFVQLQTILSVADNSGAKEVMCIKVLKGARRNAAKIGDIIIASVKAAHSNGKVKKGEVVTCVVVRSAMAKRRVDGSMVRFDSPAAVLINKAGEPVGTRVFGPMPHELRSKKLLKVLALAEHMA